tara:strand:+ start:650 stop:850 length:201 start_codon:yes stop_codon:yes gene_type:complete
MRQSSQALPIKDKPVGKPDTYPMGTVTLGYPETAAKQELPPSLLSPFKKSIAQGVEVVGATSAQHE